MPASPAPMPLSTAPMPLSTAPTAAAGAADRIVDGRISTRPALTCIIPAYNEEDSIVDTVRSIFDQSDPPEVVIVVDDGSTDRTGQRARAAGAAVIRPPTNTGSKAGAQSYALDRVSTPFTMVLDADSTLGHNAIELLRDALIEDASLAAACSYVVPRSRRTIWERGRYVEYLYAFGHGKQLQDLYGRPLISSGCFSMYRTAWLSRVGGWSSRTLAEDMDLTWTLYRMGGRVHFVQDAVCEPIEPDTGAMMATQLRRWSHGFIQNVRIHRNGILRHSSLRSIIAVSLWDGILAALMFVIVLPTLTVLFGPVALLGYVIDFPAIAVPVLVEGRRRGELREAAFSLPSFFVLRLLNSVMMLRAVFEEVIMNKRFDVYEKGH